jgi:FimV-like protein
MQTSHTKSIKRPLLTLASSGLIMIAPLARRRAGSQSGAEPDRQVTHDVGCKTGIMIAPVYGDRGQKPMNTKPRPLALLTFLALLAVGLSAVAQDTYGPVRPGESLWVIAGKVYPSHSVTRDQGMLALLKANPQAFGISCNANSALKTGSLLQVPPVNEATALSAAEAQREFRRQAREWSVHKRTAKPLTCAPMTKAASTPAATTAPAQQAQAKPSATTTAPSKPSDATPPPQAAPNPPATIPVPTTPSKPSAAAPAPTTLPQAVPTPSATAPGPAAPSQAAPTPPKPSAAASAPTPPAQSLPTPPTPSKPGATAPAPTTLPQAVPTPSATAPGPAAPSQAAPTPAKPSAAASAPTPPAQSAPTPPSPSAKAPAPGAPSQTAAPPTSELAKHEPLDGLVVVALLLGGLLLLVDWHG